MTGRTSPSRTPWRGGSPLLPPTAEGVCQARQLIGDQVSVRMLGRGRADAAGRRENVAAEAKLGLAPGDPQLIRRSDPLEESAHSRCPPRTAPVEDVRLHRVARHQENVSLPEHNVLLGLCAATSAMPGDLEVQWVRTWGQGDETDLSDAGPVDPAELAPIFGDRHQAPLE